MSSLAPWFIAFMLSLGLHGIALYAVGEFMAQKPAVEAVLLRLPSEIRGEKGNVVSVVSESASVEETSEMAVLQEEGSFVATSPDDQIHVQQLIESRSSENSISEPSSEMSPSLGVSDLVSQVPDSNSALLTESDRSATIFENNAAAVAADDPPVVPSVNPSVSTTVFDSALTSVVAVPETSESATSVEVLQSEASSQLDTATESSATSTPQDDIIVEEAAPVSPDIPQASNSQLAVPFEQESVVSIDDEQSEVITAEPSNGSPPTVLQMVSPDTESPPAEVSQDPAANQSSDLRTKTALLTPAKKSQADLRHRILDFLQAYQGGDCFLTISKELQHDRAKISSYGLSQEDFKRFINAYKTSTGAEIELGPHEITQQQCSALELTKSFTSRSGALPTLTIENSLVSDGSELVAIVESPVLSWLYIILVDDEGMAVDVSQYVSPNENRMQLKVPVHVNEEGTSRTQLLIAVASSKELTMLDITKKRNLSELLPAVLGQQKLLAAETAVSIAAFSVQ